MRSESELRDQLGRIDGRSYNAYKALRGSYDLGDCSLHIDHVQGDPFAAPSRMRVRVPMVEAQLPPALRETRTRRIALADLLARRVRDAIGHHSERRGSGKSGVIRIDAGGQEVLERSAVVLDDGWVEARVDVGLPASGRRVLGRQAEALLCGDLPALAHEGLVAHPRDAEATDTFVRQVEAQEHLRAQLRDRGLVAFVADGARLPRESGASDRPLRGDAVVPFESPASLRVTLPLPSSLETPAGSAREITGLGVPRGVTLITGGGYHGKSTLLHAIERGVHPHVPGDGREWVVSDPALVKIRAEDGRYVERVDIAGFITNLPGGRTTKAFQSEDASGSTSQAASIVEALEAGATGLLLDEDTSATNFMVRDARMQALVQRAHEPITPFLDRVREIYERAGVSSVLVMGGCGDYFDVADTVLRLRDYRADDVTEEARAIAAAHPSTRQRENPEPWRTPTARIPRAESFDASRGKREVKIDAPTLDTLRFGRETLDLRGVEQLVDASQTRAIGHALHVAVREGLLDTDRPVPALLDELDRLFDTQGLDALDPWGRAGEHPGHFARPRRFEIAAAMNRLRTLRVKSG